MKLIKIGYIQKPHGTKGELRIQIEEAYLKDVEGASVFFVEQQGQQLPFFVRQLRLGKADTVLLEDVTSREAAKQLANCAVFLQEQDISTETVETIGYAFYEGFTLTDKELGHVGVIEELLELPQQQMAMTTYQGKFVMIPMNDTFIVKVDETQKIIHLDLPEGLLEL
ncbi:MAG: ribosome maturation factor RimM [Bacteroidota bacterium]